jgi:protein tyrosine phosphatase
MISVLYGPLARSYWVVPRRFLAGAYPGAKDIADARLNIGDLLESGIRCIVNLMEQDETDHRGGLLVPYDLIVKAMASRMRTEVALLRHSIRDFGVPSTQQMVEILDAIDGTVDRGMALYVHCWGGTGRTGTVVGCYLVRHGLATATDVMDRIAFLRRLDATASRVSPETREQRRLVQSWSKGQ